MLSKIGKEKIGGDLFRNKPGCTILHISRGIGQEVTRQLLLAGQKAGLRVIVIVDEIIIIRDHLLISQTIEEAADK